MDFLERIYKKDSLSDGVEKYITSEKCRQKYPVIYPEWRTAYSKAKNIGCLLPEKVLAFKILDAANLYKFDINVVLPGVDYVETNILDQMQTALKKFIARSALGEAEVKNEDSTYLTADNFEKVLLSKGWRKPRGGMRRDRGRGRGGGGKQE